MKKKTIQEKIKNLRSHKEVIREHERDPEFKELLDRARLRVAIARQIKRLSSGLQSK